MKLMKSKLIQLVQVNIYKQSVNGCPQTKHYSWLKAADIIGIGLDQVIPVPVDHNYRMDINELEKIVRGLAEEQIPVLGVVGVVGSTEEGAVDSIDKIIALRDELMKDGIYYYVHVDPLLMVVMDVPSS